VSWTPRVIKGEKADTPPRADGLFGVDGPFLSFRETAVIESRPFTMETLLRAFWQAAGGLRAHVYDGGLSEASCPTTSTNS
jgi:hypothetical protein